MSCGRYSNGLDGELVGIEVLSLSKLAPALTTTDKRKRKPA